MPMRLTGHYGPQSRVAVGLSALLMLLLTGPMEASGQEIVLHVAPDGKDAWSGRPARPTADGQDGPLASLEAARDRLRVERAATGGNRPAIVEVQTGTYELKRPLSLAPEDSGSTEAPVTYRPAPGHRVRIVGGPSVTGWQATMGGVMRADVSHLSLPERGIRTLVHAGKRMQLARYPNFVPDNPYGGGWAFADGEPVPMYEDRPGEVRNTLLYRQADARSWKRPSEVEVFVFPRYNWWNNIVAIRSIDPGQRLITLQGDCSYAIRPGDRYYFRNALEELDAPGEWYLDLESKTLWFWPPQPITAEQDVRLPLVQPLVDFQDGTHDVAIEGFVLECGEGEAVRLQNARGCLVGGCTIRNVGDYSHSAVSVNGGTGNRIVGNDIDNVGSHGIMLQGGDRVQLEPANHVADNNYIHHMGLEYKHGVGVSMTGVGLTASRNLIHDGPRMGIQFSGNNLMIEGNHVRHMNLETEDTGAVYTGGRDWISSRGTVIRHNYFHDMLGFGRDAQGKWVSPHFAWGVYLDDNTGGVDVIGNIIARCSRAGMHLHNGRDNLVTNNIFVDNGLHQHEYSGWTKAHPYWPSHFPTMVEGYEKVAGQPAWKGMRGMDLHPRDAELPDGTIMSGNVIERNIFASSDPDSDLVRVNHFSFTHNTIDHNLVWAAGHPIRTGQHVEGDVIGPNLVPNPGFDQGELGSLPADWQWQIHPAAAQAALVEVDGQRCLRIDAAFEADKPRDNYPIVISREFAAQPGHSYRISARMKADHPDTTAQLMLQSYVAGAYFWANWPSDVRLGAEWSDVQFGFTIPAPGERGYHEQMKVFRARVDLPDPSGFILVDDVKVEEVEMLDEWASWQARGMDRHSIVADPGFVNPAQGDYRPGPDSAAWSLGFQAIPFDQIGPYPDRLRATWPIVEANGAREYPVRVPQP